MLRFRDKTHKIFYVFELLVNRLGFIHRLIDDYTENGKEKYLRLPKIVLIDTIGGNPIELNAFFLNKLKWLEQVLPNNKNSTVYIKIKRHPVDKAVLNFFKKTTYIYDICSSNMCEKLSERIVCESGVIDIEGSTVSPIINRIIENSYATIIYFKYSNEVMKTTWVIPKSVSKIILLSNNNDEDGDDGDTRVLDINFSYIKTLKNLSFIEVKFDNEFLCLESLSVVKSVATKFTKKCKMNALLEIELWDVDEVAFTCELAHLNTLFVYKGNKIAFSEKFDSLKRLTVISSEFVYLPEIDFSNKIVHFSNSKAINFNRINSLEYIQNYSDKNDLKNDLENFFEFPIPIKEEGEWKMSKFVSMSPRVEVVGNEIIRKGENEEDLYDMVVSYRFIDEFNSNDKMRFITENDEIATIANVRYFEVEVTGNSYVGVGIINVFEDINYINTMIGWQKMSCGYHSDDRMIYNGDDTSDYDTGIRYGEKTEVTNVVGVGFVVDLEEVIFDVFFICNKKIVYRKHFDADNIAAVISLNVFNKIAINYGEKPFKFDLTFSGLLNFH
ncbi:hypothetical protein EIN_161090 [Entamoeba invadens IP1]|uniref:SPRY domain-containing protein n=1 Tax=Entamoeba invadens IP1 TaxID=370355 RepID=A0A0A1U4C2_ENTIV|nr:hypothetical protein EIN_161090 [Entamoeba invadens IP1]ELP86545.1 hypothetical protein EIN_161090 [Entamoeba invadens IP1]|eukprot:XP_004185891.1 hypothetical protein EIN_161090 [Entamoeba invadens IP1]